MNNTVNHYPGNISLKRIYNLLQIPIILAILVMAGCSTNKQLIESSNTAALAYQNGDYSTAWDMYSQLIDQYLASGSQAPDSIKHLAGLSAFKLGKTQETLELLHPLRSSELATEETFFALAKSNFEISNLSREITALEEYVNRYPQGEHIDEMKTRYFETMVESENYQNAYQIWPGLLPESAMNEKLLNLYFSTLKSMEITDSLLSNAEKLLELNPDNTDAMSWLAIHYFNKAENRYQDEMNAYEQNHTRRQYATLLRGFEILNADFRKSLNYFLKLYEIDPQPRYARYIGNIYLRFDDKSKADQYHSKANQQD